MVQGQGRSPAQSLSSESKLALSNDLTAYVMEQIKKQQPLWEFGQYGVLEHDNLSKKAPLIETLIDNAPLWRVMLKHIPSGLLKDGDFVAILQTLLPLNPAIKTQNFPDQIFLSWMAKAVHIQLWHLRSLRLHTPRFSYRISLLSSEKKQVLDELLAMVVVQNPVSSSRTSNESLAPSETTSCTSAAPVLGATSFERTMSNCSLSVPDGASSTKSLLNTTSTTTSGQIPPKVSLFTCSSAVGLGISSSQSMSCTTPTDNTQGEPVAKRRKLEVPAMFLEPMEKDKMETLQSDTPHHLTKALHHDTPPKMHSNDMHKLAYPPSMPIDIFKKFADIPALPCGRGEIKQLCEQKRRSSNDEIEECALNPRIERALHGNIRTTLRVTEGGRRVSWAEVTRKRHAKHHKIICEIRDAVLKGTVTSKAEAIALKERLLSS